MSQKRNDRVSKKILSPIGSRMTKPQHFPPTGSNGALTCPPCQRGKENDSFQGGFLPPTVSVSQHRIPPPQAVPLPLTRAARLIAPTGNKRAACPSILFPRFICALVFPTCHCERVYERGNLVSIPTLLSLWNEA